MANTAIMEETVTRRDERREDRRTAAEQEHTSRISENYRKLLFDNSETWATASAENETHAESYAAPATATATLERTPVMPVHESVAPAELTQTEQAQDFSANTAHRLADYVAYAPAQGKRMLFEGLTYKNGELIDVVLGYNDVAGYEKIVGCFVHRKLHAQVVLRQIGERCLRNVLFPFLTYREDAETDIGKGACIGNREQIGPRILSVEKNDVQLFHNFNEFDFQS